MVVGMLLMALGITDRKKWEIAFVVIEGTLVAVRIWCFVPLVSWFGQPLVELALVGISLSMIAIGFFRVEREDYRNRKRLFAPLLTVID